MRLVAPLVNGRPMLLVPEDLCVRVARVRCVAARPVMSFPRTPQMRAADRGHQVRTVRTDRVIGQARSAFTRAQGGCAVTESSVPRAQPVTLRQHPTMERDVALTLCHDQAAFDWILERGDPSTISRNLGPKTYAFVRSARTFR